MTATFLAPDGERRCTWAGSVAEFLTYHDTEWGFPVAEDRRLFEKVSLEGFQSGLSWRTILAKRENFRAAFAGFDFEKVASFTHGDVERLLQDAGIRSSSSKRRDGRLDVLVFHADADAARLILDS